MPNINDPADVVNAEPGYRFRRLRLGSQRGAKQLGATVYEIPPVDRTRPYRWHHGNEKLAIVVAGPVVLRDPDGERVLEPAAAVVFRAGREGAHLFRNDASETARVLIVSTAACPDITEYPDSGKLGRFGIEPSPSG